MVNNKRRTRAWRRMRINPLPRKHVADFDYRDETALIEQALLSNGKDRCVGIAVHQNTNRRRL